MQIDTKHLNNKNTSNGTNSCEYILLHNTGVVGNGNINVLAGNTASQVSCHYLVMQDGRCYQFVDDNKICWHAGESERDGKVGMNNYSIGIEIEGPGFTDVQREVVAMLIDELMTRHNIPAKNIIRHKDVSPGRKVDVDDSFRSNQFSTFEEYQKQFDIVAEELEEDKRKAIEESKESNSVARNKAEVAKKYMKSKESIQRLELLQESLHEMNSYFRSKDY